MEHLAQVSNRSVDEIQDNFLQAILTRQEDQSGSSMKIDTPIEDKKPSNLSSDATMSTTNTQDLCDMITSRVNILNTNTTTNNSRVLRLLNLSSYSSYATIPFRNFSDKNLLFRTTLMTRTNCK